MGAAKTFHVSSCADTRTPDARMIHQAPQSILTETANPNSLLPPDEPYFNLCFKKKPFICNSILVYFKYVI